MAKALQRFGDRIIPVNPFAESILGEPAVASLERIDIVDVSRCGVWAILS